MPDSSSSTIVLLPFGACTGIIPLDAVSRSRVLGDFSSLLGSPDNRLAEPVAGDPFGAASTAAVDSERKTPWK